MTNTYEFNMLEVAMLGLSSKDGDLAINTFKHLCHANSIRLQAIHKPRELVDYRVYCSEEDFTALLDLTREFLDASRIAAMRGKL